MALTVIDAISLTPPVVAIDAWQRDFAVASAMPGDDHYAGITALMFAEAGVDPRRLGAGTTATHVPIAAGRTQFDLAHDVAGQLLARSPAAMPACRIAIHLAASLDEDVYTSTVGRLTSALGLHNTIHFSVAQLGTAALAGALDIVDAMLADAPGASALIIAAERWPLPVPRMVDDATVLADGAAALLLSTSPEAPGLRILATMNCGGKPFLGPSGVTLDREALIGGASAAVTALAAEHEIDPGTLLWLPSDLGNAVDAAVIARTGGERLHGLSNAWPDFNRMSAAVPTHLADILGRGVTAVAGRTLVGWGASYAGGFGITLFQPVERTTQ